MPQVPSDSSIDINTLHRDPYPIYRRLRRETPVLNVPALGRIFLTKADDIRNVKDNPSLFRSGGTETPMERAFQATTLMRKDGDDHTRDRQAMAPAFSPRNLKDHWHGIYFKTAQDCLDRLPRNGTIDIFHDLAAPYAARCLAHLLGIESASDAQMIHWSQTLIDGAGNFAWKAAPFQATDAANIEMNALFEHETKRHLHQQGPSALSTMVNAADPIELSQIRANLKIAIGGGINEPRDALCTILFGLLTNPEYLAATKEDPKWFAEAFEEGVRWVAPIQTSSRRAAEDTEIRNMPIAKDQIVMTIQASAGHDEDIHKNPEHFDLFRPKKTHQSFASGPHFCQGTHVARMMLIKVMLPLLFERFPNISLPDPHSVPWYGFAFRGPTSLPIRLA
ncbi:Cytochrome P450-pinF2, plant-inducible [Falsiruegeria litorea R37]|uniref:Cytochrome P450-pinF2, plant-inducible n=1 Tax=Falsiruegeria litorea R37 TaxID=1200284 RepID=A0A1Y5TK82_9RHOB|nr:cytochrome P450 [Falsiruegeria litorea]SLN62366.1 Cytochrome P450-pinF2, plant-inducible [Falsiruegeria litorea R37]